MWRPHRRTFLTGAAVLSGMTLVSAKRDARSGVAHDAARSGRRFGAAVRADRMFADTALRRAVVGDCHWITPEFDFNWNALEYERGRWWFERADALVRFARANDQDMRGHSLLWDQSTPDWVKAELPLGRDWRLIEHWFSGVLGRYAADASEWDVVNEAIDTEHGDAGFRRTCFQRAFGNDYVGRAFHTARALAPDLKLFINEYGLDYSMPVERDRRLALLRLVERLKRDGVPIDGVGLQAHLDLRKGEIDAAGIAAMIRDIADMGMTITITELDVMEADRSQSLAARDQAVADAMRRYLDVVLAEPAVRGVTVWGVSDRDSWLQEQPGADPAILNRGLPYDAELRPKRAYRALTDAFNAAASPGRDRARGRARAPG